MIENLGGEVSLGDDPRVFEPKLEREGAKQENRRSFKTTLMRGKIRSDHFKVTTEKTDFKSSWKDKL